LLALSFIAILRPTLEETSAASVSLAGQTEQLNALLATFRLEPPRESFHGRSERAAPARTA